MTRTILITLAFLSMTMPSFAALELIPSIEAKLIELFQEKDPIASDQVVLLASRYRKLTARPLPEGEQRRALAELLEQCQRPLPVGLAAGDVGLVPADEAAKALIDGGDRESLREAVRSSLAVLRSLKTATFPFGHKSVRKTDVIATLEAFAKLEASEPDPGKLAAKIAKAFDVYRSPGLPGSGDVLYTGYHEPMYEGALEADARHRWPVYREPKTIGIPNEKFSRGEVAAGALKGKGLEIVWFADPLDAYLLEIQGSGFVKLADGRYVRIQFAAKNGQAYKSLGKTMVREGLLKPWEMDIPSIRRVLAEKPDKLRPMLDSNPSQIYFRSSILEEAPERSNLVGQRSVACDNGYFPRGLVGFAALERPAFGADGRLSGWAPHRRFILNHDTGSAIRGPGHIDLYWGHSAEASRLAGSTKDPGALFYLLRKGTALAPRR
jgi:membrane-bound lytic murein transglycosylase A